MTERYAPNPIYRTADTYLQDIDKRLGNTTEDRSRSLDERIDGPGGLKERWRKEGFNWRTGHAD